MDPNKQPLSPTNQPSDDIDEAQAAAILSAARPSADPAAAAPAPAPGTSVTDGASSAGPVSGPAFTPAASAPDAPAPAAFGQAPVAPSVPADPAAVPPPPASGFTPSPVFHEGQPSPTSPALAGAATGIPTAATPNAFPGSEIAPKKSKKTMFIGVIAAAVVLVLLGASAAAYYVVMNKPQNVLNMALVNSFAAKDLTSVSFDGDFNIKPKLGPSYKTTFNGSSSTSGAFSVNAEIDALVTKVKLDAKSADGSTYYFRVGGLEGAADLFGGSSSFTAYYGPIINALNNQWIEVSSSMIKQLTGSDVDATSKLSDADRQKLADAYKDHQFLVVSKTLKDEAIKGHASHHYQIVVDKTQLKAFAAAVKQANISSLKVSGQSLQSFNSEVDKISFSKYPVDLWIGKGDKRIDQVGFTANSNGDVYSLRFTVSDYNKPVHVTAPDSSKTILEIIGLFTSSFSNSTSDFTGLEGISL